MEKKHMVVPLLIALVLFWFFAAPITGAVAYITIDSPEDLAELKKSHHVLVEDYSLAKSSYLVEVTVRGTVWPDKTKELKDELDDILGPNNYEYHHVRDGDWLFRNGK